MTIEQEKKAIDRIKAFEPLNEPYFLCYSGGKDSDTVLLLARLAGVRFEAIHNLTTVDAPETVRYVQAQKEIRIETPAKSMWQLIEENKRPPTRAVRYCCRLLKETSGKNRVKITGVRWDESKSRRQNQGVATIIGKPKAVETTARHVGAEIANNENGSIVLNLDNDPARRLVEQCYRTTTTLVNPIIDWTDEDVWAFLHHYGCRSNPLYEAREKAGTFVPCGERRIGCIGCPLSGGRKMKKDFMRYPKYRDNYLRAFDRMLRARKESGMQTDSWRNAVDVMLRWVEEDPFQQRIYQPDWLWKDMDPALAEHMREEQR